MKTVDKINEALDNLDNVNEFKAPKTITVEELLLIEIQNKQRQLKPNSWKSKN
jgi:hypothetical protein